MMASNKNNTQFAKEVLESQDGKKVLLILENGGPVIGEAVLKYNAAEGVLEADMRIDNLKVAEFLMNELAYSINKES